jgi:hypothetical protein
MAAGGTAVVAGPVVVPPAAGRDAAVTLVTVIMVVVVGLTFAFGFGFGNVFQLGLRLGVPRGWHGRDRVGCRRRGRGRAGGGGRAG